MQKRPLYRKGKKHTKIIALIILISFLSFAGCMGEWKGFIFHSSSESSFAMSPSILNFGTLETGEYAENEITISNQSSTDIDISNITLSDAANYALDVSGGSNPCGSTNPTISAGEGCTVAVTFEPSITGTYSGELILDSDDPGASGVSVALTGTCEFNPPPDNTVTLTWAAPSINVDGSPLTDLAGFKVYYGPSSGSYTDIIDVGNTPSCTLENMPTGTMYFCVTAYDSSGNESDYSNEVSKMFN